MIILMVCLMVGYSLGAVVLYRNSGVTSEDSKKDEGFAGLVSVFWPITFIVITIQIIITMVRERVE